MVTGFLEDNCMEFTTGSRDNIGRISAVAMGLGPLVLECPKLIMGRITQLSLGKGATSERGQGPLELWAPA